MREETRPWPKPAADEVVVQICAAPINPADLNAIEGKYPVRPELPATPGFEGAGVVIDLGSDVTGMTAGALVILPHNLGTWREAVAVKASELVAAPPRRCGISADATLRGTHGNGAPNVSHPSIPVALFHCLLATQLTVALATRRWRMSLATWSATSPQLVRPPGPAPSKSTGTARSACRCS